MKIYLDDVRETPPGWTRTYTAPETINLLWREREYEVEALSLDHDLGVTRENDPTGIGNGYDVLLWLEEQVALGLMDPPDEIAIHSSNAGARKKMEQAIDRIYDFAAEIRD